MVENLLQQIDNQTLALEEEKLNHKDTKNQVKLHFLLLMFTHQKGNQ